MHETQRRQLVVGSAVVVTVGAILYHVFFRKPNTNSLPNGNDRRESTQVEAKASVKEQLIRESVEDETVVTTTEEAVPIEATEKPGNASTEESLHESASEEDETNSVADGESTDATEEEIVKEIERQHEEPAEPIVEQLEEAVETVLTTSEAVEAALYHESMLEAEDKKPGPNGVEMTVTTITEPKVPKSPWEDMPAVKESNVWDSPDWTPPQQPQQSEQSTARHSELNVNSAPFVPKQKIKRIESPEQRREMMNKQRQTTASFKARCRYWPKCTNKKCKYVHPMYPCR
ncbi:hypothetical protein BGW37DRAFT_464760 [Umbelopsis sp. PMI_123]|nr:hypothetical protein BGW37DRAFT_464760 [Umbelopsis sp. PMI_123]